MDFKVFTALAHVRTKPRAQSSSTAKTSPLSPRLKTKKQKKKKVDLTSKGNSNVQNPGSSIPWEPRDLSYGLSLKVCLQVCDIVKIQAE